ncbi:uncharacterized protein [Primulina eburnea]|uniref:uncharacterized protein isoform X2 n=1 Tax=Primulina eburnea TaxID=1245227 RepID=UPI003C6C96D2
MDKSWIHLDRRSKQYEEGVELFIRGCLEKSHIDPNLIHCPCCKCKNLKKRPAKSIREHLYFHGFSQNYVNWIWHGESAESDKVNWSTNKEPIGKYHGNFETTNMCEAAYDNYTENPEAFMEFLEEAEKPLYNGCKRYTKLSAIVKLYNNKAKHGMSDALFSDLLMDFGDMLPDNHNLPTKMKQYKDCVNCPKCGLSRWKLTKKKGVPAKVCTMPLRVFLKGQGNMKQSGSVECGYCVMRYMKEIVDCDDPHLEKMFAGCIKNQYYTQCQFDEVRSEWSEFVYSHVGA